MARYDSAKNVMVHAQDLLQSREASETARCGRLSARSYVQDTLQACADKEGWAQVYFATMPSLLYTFRGLASYHELIMSSITDPCILQVQVMSDCGLLQYNKVWAKIRALQSLNQSRQTLIHQMAHVQTSMQRVAAPPCKQTRLTLYEAALLRDSKKLEQHQQSLEATAGLVAECKQATNSAQTFFSWMASLHESWQQASYLRPVSKKGHMYSLTPFWPNLGQMHDIYCLVTRHLASCA